MASAEMFQGNQEEKSLDRSVAWYAGWIGLSSAAIGAFIAPSLIVPGLVLATGAYAYHESANSK